MRPPAALTQETNPGGARWCEEHDRLECTKNRSKNRGQCHQASIRGMNACRLHVGMHGSIAKAQGEARITAWCPAGETSVVDASTAVLGVLQMSYLRLKAYSQLLSHQVATQGQDADDPSELNAPQASGLIGYRYGAAGKDGVVYVQSEEIRALVVLEAQERDRVVKFAKTAHDMGISERTTALAERWGDVVATRISLLLEALSLTPAQTALVPHLLQFHLSSIDMTEMEPDGR